MIRDIGFQNFWDFRFNHKETNRKLNCLQSYKAGQVYAENKIESLEGVIDLYLSECESLRLGKENCTKKIETLNKALKELIMWDDCKCDQYEEEDLCMHCIAIQDAKTLVEVKK